MPWCLPRNLRAKRPSNRELAPGLAHRNLSYSSGIRGSVLVCARPGFLRSGNTPCAGPLACSRGGQMISGAHVILYSKDAEADRAFFRVVLGFKSVDAGHDWLIFALPPAEAAFHPSEANG